MSKVFEAECESGEVTIPELSDAPCPEASILSEGVGSSSGFLLISAGKKVYLAKVTPDLKATIEKAASALSTIASALTAIGAGMTGATTAPPPTLAASVTSINTVVSELNTLKEDLR
jgi:hypothetical protein